MYPLLLQIKLSSLIINHIQMYTVRPHSSRNISAIETKCEYNLVEMITSRLQSRGNPRTSSTQDITTIVGVLHFGISLLRIRREFYFGSWSSSLVDLGMGWLLRTNIHWFRTLHPPGCDNNQIKEQRRNLSWSLSSKDKLKGLRNPTSPLAHPGIII